MIIDAGVEALARQEHWDKQERWLAMFSAAESLEHDSQRATASSIRGYLAGMYKTEVLASGLCPHCGCELSVQSETQYHPYGDMTAAERLVTYVCPNCGGI